MKKLILTITSVLLLNVCAQATIITPEENQIWWGYFNENDFEDGDYDYTIGTGSAMTLMAAIYIPANHEQLGSATIRAIRFYLDPSTISSLSNMRVWIAKQLPSRLKEMDYAEVVSESLSGGANDIMLSTPYSIDNQGVYVGYYVKSTTGYFIRSGGSESVENSFLLGNPDAGMDWMDLSSGYDFGKLALQILVEGGNFTDYCATVEDFKPAVVEKGQNVEIPITVTNLGKVTINELSYTITVNGETSEERTLSSLSIPYGAKKDIMFPFESAASEGTNTYKLTLTKINGNDNIASQNTATGNITTVENLKIWPRNVLIEEFTTESCVYCPQAASGLASFIKTYPDLAERVAVACHHAGYGTDWLTVSASSSYLWFYNAGGSTYAPAFMYDRYAWDGKTPVESRQANAAGYKSRVEARIAKDSYANIELDAEFNEEMTAISVTANCERSWEFCDTEPRITFFLTEDNITAKSQSGASGTFVHQHVLRAVNQTWGNVLSWTDNKASATYTFNLKSAWKTDDLKVIAFISGYDKTDATNCVVENVAVAAPSLSTSIGAPTAADSKATYYSLDGRKLPAAEKGINIVHTNDGTVKKILVK